MRKVLSLLPIVLAVTAAGCVFSPGIRGSGNVVSEQRTVNGFTAVSLEGSGRLTIAQGETESLAITADDNLMPYLTSEIKDGQLTLGTKNNENIDPSKDVVYKLTMKNVSAIGLAGSGSVDAKGIHAERLKIVVAGSGGMSVAGTAAQQEITLAGSGEFRGDDLKSKVVTIQIAGSGGAALNVSEKLEASIAGSGGITYRGDAAVTRHILGSGTIEKR